MSNMLRIGNNVMSSSQHFNLFKRNANNNCNDWTSIGINGISDDSVFGPKMSSSLESNPLSSPLILSSLSCNPWNTGFWNNLNNSCLQMTDQNNGFNYFNDNKDVLHAFQDWTPFVAHNNNNLMTYVEEYNCGLTQAPIGTPKTRQSLANNGVHAVNGVSEERTIGYIQPRMRRRLPTLMECVFCKNNNEEPDFYKSHILKDPESRILCPILRAYDCPICRNGGGERAHTVRYCPLNRAGTQLRLANIINTQNETNNEDIVADNKPFISDKTYYRSKYESKSNRRKRRLINK